MLTSYRKSVALRNSFNYNFGSNSNEADSYGIHDGMGTKGIPLIVDCDSKGKVHVDTIDEMTNVHEITQL